MQLLALLCQPAEVQGFVPLPTVDRLLGDRFRHPACRLGLGLHVGAHRRVHGLSDHRRGCGAAKLAAIRRRRRADRGSAVVGLPREPQPGRVRSRFASVLPETMRGDEFLERYGGTTDRVTRVDPGRTYAVRQPTAHPIREHARVRRFAELLAGHPDDAALGEMGELMYASHASYSACGLGSDGTDLLVELVRRAGPAAGPVRGQDHRGRERRDRRHPGEGRRGAGRRGDRPRLSRADRPTALRLRRLVAGRLRIRRA